MTDLQSIREQNRRATARGHYTRWLLTRFGTLDMMSVKEGEEKVHLRNIYIPLRIDINDRADESMGKINKVDKEQLIGSDARDIIAENRFVAISGRPGSGKTTLVQAIIEELCSKKSSEFRTRLVGTTGILPVPLILREYQEELHQVNTLDDLLNLWWDKAEVEAKDKQKFTGTRLDIKRIKQSCREDEMPMLLLFDGIDEVGGVEPRKKIVRLAQEAHKKGYWLVLTGRPSGYDGIHIDEVMRQTSTGMDDIESVIELNTLYHAQPFTWPQIQEFIKRFYLLHDEWKMERQQGIKDINQALQSRDYLLTLARRPIFLTLMALVHINDRRMPHGRADLYKRIIDLYLIRQTHQRRIKFTVQNTPMPHWQEQEVRRGLGYLAWLSQHKGAEEKANGDRDKRQVIWSRPEMETALTKLLKGELEGYHGRFRDIPAEKARELLDYYLNPAGLLVEPAEEQIQFAHLSFQEYLCAEYIHGRALARGSRRFLDSIEKRLYKYLHLPGWDEVGMLLLTIHAGQGVQTEPVAHLELLAELDPSNVPEADLLIKALTGKELDYPDGELLCWLPVVVAALLIHPDKKRIKCVQDVSVWVGENELGLKLLEKLFSTRDQVDGLWDILVKDVQNSSSEILSQEQTATVGLMDHNMRCYWQRLPKNCNGDVVFSQKEARSHSLLLLAVESGWVKAEPEQSQLYPIADTKFEQILTAWLNQQNPILFQRSDELLLPVQSPTGYYLDEILPVQGELWKTCLARIPLDIWLLQGESFYSQASVLLSFYPLKQLPANITLALGLYQCLQITEALVREDVDYLGENLLQSFLPLRSLLLMQLWSWSESRLSSLLRLKLRGQSLLMSQSHSPSISLSELLLNNQKLSPYVQKILHKIENGYFKNLDSESMALKLLGYRYAAHDWFAEQAESPALMKSRGLRPGQPLPPKLEIFDDSGRLRSPLHRQSIVQLQNWLQDDQQILAWFFPDGLSEEWKDNLEEQLTILWKQPWSPRHAIAATLANWPEDLLERETTLASIEQPLIDALLADVVDDETEE